FSGVIAKFWDQIKRALGFVRGDGVVRFGAGTSAPAPAKLAARQDADIVTLCETLLARKDENSGIKLGALILDKYQASSEEERCRFLEALGERFGADLERVDLAIAAYQTARNDITLRELENAVEPRRQRLIRLLNLAPHGTARLVQMRADAIRVKNRIAK